MLKKISLVVFITFMTILPASFCSNYVHAQGNTKIILTAEKTECYVGDTVKVTVQGQNVADMYGLQFTINYDPGMLQLQGEDMTFQEDYIVFGGKTVDASKGILTYPLINQNASNQTKAIETVGYVTFKALKKGAVTLTLNNIKAVDSNSNVISNNTQYVTSINLLEKPVPTPAPVQASGVGNSTTVNNTPIVTKGTSEAVANTKTGSANPSANVNNGQPTQANGISSQQNTITENSNTESKKESAGKSNDVPDQKEIMAESQDSNGEAKDSNAETGKRKAYFSFGSDTLALSFIFIILTAGSVLYGTKNKKLMKAGLIQITSRLKVMAREGK